MNMNRVNELMANIHAYGKEEYLKSEQLNEMLTLQSEIVKLTFNDEHASNADLKIYDVERHLEQLNEEAGHVADEELRRFMDGSKNLCNLIRAEISGAKGEYKAFRTLEFVKSPKRILKNTELEDDQFRTELDATVITSKCITIVEVKNTSKNIFIDEDGSYYRTGEFLKWDCNIKEKMLFREKLLKELVEKAGFGNVKIQSVVVFTDSRVEVQNKCADIKTCFPNQLSYIIDGFKGEQIYSEEDMELIKNAIESAECKRRYPADFDAEQYKRDFAMVMTAIEEAASKAREEEIVSGSSTQESEKSSMLDTIKTIFTSRYVRYAGSAAAGFALAIIAKAVTSNTIKR